VKRREFSANEIAAWSGQSLREVERYTPDQARLARNALVRTSNNVTSVANASAGCRPTLPRGARVDRRTYEIVMLWADGLLNEQDPPEGCKWVSP
jgi:hypothetical protein